MKVKCYREGREGLSGEYDDAPHSAARAYCCEYEDASGQVNVIAEPVDEEARALPGWHEDGDGPPFKMFIVVPSVAWTPREVSTLNPYAPK